MAIRRTKFIPTPKKPRKKKNQRDRVVATCVRCGEPLYRKLPIPKCSEMALYPAFTFEYFCSDECAEKNAIFLRDLSGK